MPDRFGEIPIQPPQSSSPKKRAKKRPPPLVIKPLDDKAPARIKAWAWTIGAVLIFALYSCLGFLGVPYYLSEILPKKLNKKTGMVLKSNGIKFNPLTFQLESGKVQILSGSSPIISLNSFVTDLAPLSLLRRDLVSNTLTIDELTLNLVRELNGSYNVQKLLGDKKVSDTTRIMDFSDLPFFFSLNNITINNSRIIFNDSPAGKTHTIENIQLALPTFSNIPFQADQYLRPRFSAIIDGSPVELTGQALMGESDVNDQVTNLSCDIHSLNLSLYSGYLPFTLPFEINQGKADGKIVLNFNPQEEKGNKLSIDFELQISGVELQSENQSVIIAAPTARVSGKLLPVSRLLILDSIALRGPRISSYGESFSKNISDMLQHKQHSDTSDVSQLSPFHLITDLLIVDDATVSLFMKRQDHSPTGIWKSLQLSVKKYTTKANNRDQNNGSFRISGEKEETSSYFSWQGTMPTPKTLKGSLTLAKIAGSDLLEAIGQDHFFQIQGSAALKGQLSIHLTKDTLPAINYVLTDSEISIEGFSLIDKEQTLLEAPLVKIQGLSYAKGMLDLGNVYLRNSIARFPYDSIPEPFSLFGSGSYQVQGFEFDGKTILDLPVHKDGSQLIFSNLTVKANELNTPDKTKPNLSLSAKSSSGGILKAQGYLKLAPFSLSVTTGFQGLPAKDVLPFFSKASLLENIDGVLSGKGSFSLPKMSIAGEFQLKNGSMKHSDDSIFSWKDSVFQDVNYTAEPFHLGVALAEVISGDLGWLITENEGEPLQQLAVFFQNNFPIKHPPGKKQATFLPVEIREILFSNTKVHIQDHRLNPKWEAEVVGLAGKIQHVNSGDSDSTSIVTFTGEIDDSPFAGQGEIALFAKEGNGKVHFTLENYPLASYHEQLSPRLDINTSVGEFDLTLDSKWQDKKYHSSGSLMLTDIEPVSKMAQSALPLALLTGADNTYLMNFDVSRSAPVGKTVLLEKLLTHFQTSIVKGSVSPLLLATGDFTDLIGNEFIEFKPGQFMISDKGREVLTRFTALLIAHPYLGLELSGGIDKQFEENAIRKQLEGVELKRVENENKKLFKKWQTEKVLYEAKLREQQKRLGENSTLEERDIPDDIFDEFRPLQPEPVVIDATILIELAIKRLNVLHQHFSTQLALDPERITIAQPNVLDAETEGPVNGVSITLKAIDR